MRMFWTFTALLLIGTQVDAAGFDASYNVFSGDLNADERPDLYIKSSRTLVIPFDEIPIVIGPPVRDFVLQAKPDGTFDVILPLTSAQRATVAQWPAAQISLSFRDVDMDGHGDMDMISIRDVVPGARDQIVLGSNQWGGGPKRLITKTDKFRNFHNDLQAAIQNPNYFNEYAPTRVTGTEPGSRVYYGGIINAGAFAPTELLMSWCRYDYPSAECHLSTADPVPCTRTVDLYNDNGEYVGTTIRNVCNDHLHVFVYVPGSVTVAKDYSVFDEHARESKQILDRLQNGCALFSPSADTQRINEILGSIYGAPISNTDRFFQNSTPHPPAPGDELLDRNDPTFHHYDVRTKLCKVGQPSCNLVAANSYLYMGLRAFTYPSQRLQPTYTAVDGSQLTVYVPLPWKVNNPDAFVAPFGRITQRFAQSGYWAEGVQNVTTPEHWVYPGTIIRKMFQDGDSLYVRTHGIGMNRFWCVPAGGHPAQVAGVNGVRMIMAASNDYFGAKTFATLDRQFSRYWRTQNSYPAGMAKPSISSPSGGDEPASISRRRP
jgi:hypothetical protein